MLESRSARDWLLLIADAIELWPSLRSNADLPIATPAGALAAMIRTHLAPSDQAAVDAALDGTTSETGFPEGSPSPGYRERARD
jgi:hypothetical protein